MTADDMPWDPSEDEQRRIVANVRRWAARLIDQRRLRLEDQRTHAIRAALQTELPSVYDETLSASLIVDIDQELELLSHAVDGATPDQLRRKIGKLRRRASSARTILQAEIDAVAIQAYMLARSHWSEAVEAMHQASEKKAGRA